MQAYKRIKITSISADVTLLDDGSTTELCGACHINNNTLEVEVNDDSTIVIPVGHYEDIEIYASAGDCCVRLIDSVVDHISVESLTGDIEVEADTDNVSMSSTSGNCIKH